MLCTAHAEGRGAAAAHKNAHAADAAVAAVFVGDDVALISRHHGDVAAAWRGAVPPSAPQHACGVLLRAEVRASPVELPEPG